MRKKQESSDDVLPYDRQEQEAGSGAILMPVLPLSYDDLAALCLKYKAENDRLKKCAAVKHMKSLTKKCKTILQDGGVASKASKDGDPYKNIENALDEIEILMQSYRSLTVDILNQYGIKIKSKIMEEGDYTKKFLEPLPKMIETALQNAKQDREAVEKIAKQYGMKIEYNTQEEYAEKVVKKLPEKTKDTLDSNKLHKNIVEHIGKQFDLETTSDNKDTLKTLPKKTQAAKKMLLKLENQKAQLESREEFFKAQLHQACVKFDLKPHKNWTIQTYLHRLQNFWKVLQKQGKRVAMVTEDIFNLEKTREELRQDIERTTEESIKNKLRNICKESGIDLEETASTNDMMKMIAKNLKNGNQACNYLNDLYAKVKKASQRRN